MADISKITLPSGSTYDIKDAVARNDIEALRTTISGGVSFLGVTTNALTDGSSTNPITVTSAVGGVSVTYKNQTGGGINVRNVPAGMAGSTVVTSIPNNGTATGTGNTMYDPNSVLWIEVTYGGKTGYAQSTFLTKTSTETTSTTSITATNGNMVIYGDKEFIYSTSDNKWHELGSTGALKALAYKDSASTSYTPAGTVTKPSFTGTAASLSHTVSGTINSAGKFTPAGSVGTPTITVTLNSATKYVAASATGGGSVTAGSAASCTLPSMSTSVANETLTIGWSAGSFTANTPTSVTLPSFSSQTIATGVKSASSTQPSFTGTEGDVAVSGAANQASVTAHSYTPAGGVSQPTFSGTAATITVS